MNLDCVETQARFDDHRIGNLPDAERAGVEEHLDGCPACRESLRVLTGLETAVGRAEPDPMFRRRVAVAVSRPGAIPRRKPLALRPALVLTASAAALATLAILLLHPALREAGENGERGRSGGTLSTREAPLASTASASDAPVTALAEPISPPGAETGPDGDGDGEPVKDPGPGSEVAIRSTAVAAAGAKGGRTSATGSHEIREAIRDGRLDEARRMVEGGPVGPDEVGLLMSLARAYRRARLFGPAVEVYERLIARHGSTPEAANALVALGQLELDALGRPAAAAEHFAEHVRRTPDGYLCEAARVGRVRALYRLGGGAACLEAANDYLRWHPGGPAAAEVLRLRGELRADGGRCAEALGDFQAVLDRWPGSRDAERATEGLARCGAAPLGN